MPALNRINDRISSYQKRITAWQEVTQQHGFLQLSATRQQNVLGCQQQVDDILTDYTRLQESLTNTDSQRSKRSLLNRNWPQTQNKDIHYIEGHCSGLLTSLQSLPQDHDALQDYAISLTDLAQQGKYDKLVRSYESLPLAPGEPAGFEATFVYGLALLKTGREYDARRVLNDLYVRSQDLDQEQQSTLLKMLADINFGLGDFATAQKRYNELLRVYGSAGEDAQWPQSQLAVLDYSYGHTEEVQYYASLIRHFLSYNPSRDGFTVVNQASSFLHKYPQSALLAPRVHKLQQQAEQFAEQWFADILAEIDSLSKAGQIQQAAARIDSIPASILPVDKQAILRLKKQSIIGYSSPELPAEDETIQEEVLHVPQDSAVQESVSLPGQNIEPQIAQNTPALDDGLQRTWNQAIKDMQAKNYDQSLELFTGLLNTSYKKQAQERIREVSLLAARQSRKQAAELFVRSNRVTDDRERKKILLASRALLEDILHKYPQSGLENKVRRNLNRIDQELAAISQTTE